MVEGGVDAIEIGMPYSDPLMEGPVIQAAHQAALQAGTRTADVLRTVRGRRPRGRHARHGLLEPRARVRLRPLGGRPVRRGRHRRDHADLIPEEAPEWLAAAAEHGIDPIFLVAPSSTDERIAVVGRTNRGFVYAAAVMGVTGARSEVGAGARRLVERVRAATDLPVAVGLGVSTGEQAAQVAEFADAVVVGMRAGVRPAVVRRAGRRAHPHRAAGRGRPAAGPRGLGCGRDPGLPPEPRAGRLAPRAVPAAGLRAVHHRRRRPGGRRRRPRFVARGGSPGVVADVATIAVPFGLLGARVYHVVTSPAAYLEEPVRALFVWEGGPASRGRARRRPVGYVVCRAAASRRGVRRRDRARGRARAGGGPVRQLVQPGALRPADDAALGAGDRRGAPPTELLDVATYHPAFLYEALWNVGVAGVLLWADRRWRLGGGRVFALYLALFAVGRMWIEALRIDNANTFFGVRLNVFVMGVVLVGSVTYLVRRRRAGREAVVEPLRART